MSVGMPAGLKLHEFGSLVWDAFDTTPYHVGSSMGELKSGWRDVDVRVILEDHVWDAMGLGEPGQERHNGKWVALVRAFSALGQEMTGLPIDFQIQRFTQANREYDKPRSAIGIVPLRMAKYEQKSQVSSEQKEFNEIAKQTGYGEAR